MQFRIKGEKKWVSVSGSANRITLYKNKSTTLLEYIVKGLEQYFSHDRIVPGKKMWLIFSKEDERVIDAIASEFLPLTGDRSAIFINCILNTLREIRKERIFTTYITLDPSLPITDAKPHQLRLAIEFIK